MTAEKAVPATAEGESVLPPTTLVLGGTRSGKSAYAERLLDGKEPRFYLATAEAGDGEMAERIAQHRQRRGADWTTLEEPLDLVGTLDRHGQTDGAILVDCLTLWLSNLMAAERDIAHETARLVDACRRIDGAVVFVSNEVGQGIVPASKVGRVFRDHAGRLNQAVAAAVDHVVLMTAGLPLILKNEPGVAAHGQEPAA